MAKATIRPQNFKKLQKCKIDCNTQNYEGHEEGILTEYDKYINEFLKEAKELASEMSSEERIHLHGNTYLRQF